MSRVEYCNVVFAGAPKAVTNKLQRVLNAAARVVSGTRKFDRGLMQLLHVELHWLDVPERVKYKLSMITRWCLNGTAPQYLAAHCLCNWIKATSAFCCQSSAGCAIISTEFLRTSGLLCCWSDDVELSPKQLRDPVHTSSIFGRLLKTFLFSEY